MGYRGICENPFSGVDKCRRVGLHCPALAMRDIEL